MPHSHTNVCNICMVVRGARSHCLKHPAVPKMPSTNLKCYINPRLLRTSPPANLQYYTGFTQRPKAKHTALLQYTSSNATANPQQSHSNTTAIPLQSHSNLTVITQQSHSNLQTIPQESNDNLAAIPEQSLGNSKVIRHKYCSRAKAAP